MGAMNTRISLSPLISVISYNIYVSSESNTYVFNQILYMRCFLFTMHYELDSIRRINIMLSDFRFAESLETPLSEWASSCTNVYNNNNNTHVRIRRNVYHRNTHTYTLYWLLYYYMRIPIYIIIYNTRSSDTVSTGCVMQRDNDIIIRTAQ